SRPPLMTTPPAPTHDCEQAGQRPADFFVVGAGNHIGHVALAALAGARPTGVFRHHGAVLGADAAAVVRPRHGLWLRYRDRRAVRYAAVATWCGAGRGRLPGGQVAVTAVGVSPLAAVVADAAGVSGL